jgi:hypothetical protein
VIREADRVPLDSKNKDLTLTFSCDGHVAWRGNACPDEPMAAIDRIRGDLCALLAGEKR